MNQGDRHILHPTLVLLVVVIGRRLDLAEGFDELTSGPEFGGGGGFAFAFVLGGGSGHGREGMKKETSELGEGAEAGRQGHNEQRSPYWVPCARLLSSVTRRREGPFSNRASTPTVTNGSRTFDDL